MSTPQPNPKEYLGDGLYAEYDGFAIWLTAEDGIHVLHRICLEPEVYRALLRFHDEMQEKVWRHE